MKILRVTAFCAALAVAGAAGAADKKSGSAAKGKEIFQGQCVVCHNAESADKKMGPGLKDLFKADRKLANGKKVTEANVRAQLDAGGKGMPSYKDMLSDEEKTDLIAYLKTL
jgi:mono/diheme cytochrome c family protein